MEVYRTSHLLTRADVRMGDCIALLLPTCPEAAFVLEAARQLGLYCTPIGTGCSEAAARHILADCEPKLVVASRALPLAAALAGQPPGARWIWLEGRRGFAELLREQPTTPLRSSFVGRIVRYASGPDPKRIVRALQPRDAAPGDALAGALGLDGRSVVLVPAADDAVDGHALARAAFDAGAALVVAGRLDPGQTLAAVAEYGVTHLVVGPSNVDPILRLPAAVRDGYDLSSLARVLYGAAPCPEEIACRMIDWFGDIVAAWDACGEQPDDRRAT
jgi:fatty-acyl-CoA synthase